MTEETIYHTPVMLAESIDKMQVEGDTLCADLTFGGGGHSREILSRMGAGGTLYGFDQDEDAEGNAPDDDRFVFVRSNFRYLRNFMRYHGVEGLDAILADLGVSGHHFDDETRGFSFRFDADLDMRMNKRGGETAADLLNTATEEKLAEIFKIYGELNCSRKLASAVVKRRATRPYRRVSDLIETAKPFCPPQREKKEMAKPGGRLVVITYHSIEDRIVKNFMKSGNIEGKIEQDFFGRSTSPYITEKIITPTDEELERNPRSRSAKLRVATKKEETAQ